MGQTATCEAEIDGQPVRGEALLETAELIFRGTTPRLRVPFASMKQVTVIGDKLKVIWRKPGRAAPHAGSDAATIVLTLGARAEVWADKIKNPPSRLDKLGVKAGMKVAVWGQLDPTALAELQKRADVRVGKPRGGEALVFLAVESAAELARLREAAGKIAPDGAVWVVRRKGKEAVVSEAASMAAGKAAGLVDTKVAAFSATHTAERYVIPVAARAR